MRSGAVLGGVVLWASAGLAFAQNSALIVPGHSVGKIRIGSVLPSRLRGKNPWADLVVRAPSGHSSWVSVYSDSSHGAAPIVSAIRLVSPEWKLGNGISTSTPVAQIRRAFPTLHQVATYRNSYFGPVAVFEVPAQGIAFDFASDKPSGGHFNKCLVISVFQPPTLLAALNADPALKSTLRLSSRR